MKTNYPVHKINKLNDFPQSCTKPLSIILFLLLNFFYYFDHIQWKETDFLKLSGFPKMKWIISKEKKPRKENLAKKKNLISGSIHCTTLFLKGLLMKN